jgi:polyferredoxin
LLLLVATSAAIISFALRKPFKVDVMRDRASLVQETRDGRLENSYMLNMINTTSQDQQFSISVSGLPEMAISSPQRCPSNRPTARAWRCGWWWIRNMPIRAAIPSCSGCSQWATRRWWWRKIQLYRGVRAGMSTGAAPAG